VLNSPCAAWKALIDSGVNLVGSTCTDVALARASTTAVKVLFSKLAAPFYGIYQVRDQIAAALILTLNSGPFGFYVFVHFNHAVITA
jgi:hypothetical protein